MKVPSRICRAMSAIKVVGEDYRPAVVADDVNGLKMTNFVISQADAEEGKQQIITHNVTDFECK